MTKKSPSAREAAAQPGMKEQAEQARRADAAERTPREIAQHRNRPEERGAKREQHK